MERKWVAPMKMIATIVILKHTYYTYCGDINEILTNDIHVFKLPILL